MVGDEFLRQVRIRVEQAFGIETHAADGSSGPALRARLNVDQRIAALVVRRPDLIFPGFRTGWLDVREDRTCGELSHRRFHLTLDNRPRRRWGGDRAEWGYERHRQRRWLKLGHAEHSGIDRDTSEQCRVSDQGKRERPHARPAVLLLLCEIVF